MLTRLLSVLALTLLISAACTTKVDGLYVSDSFNTGELKKESLLAGGVSDAKTGLPRNESILYSGVMLSKIKDERKFVNVKPIETLIQALGEKTYDSTIVKYTNSGLDEVTLGQIASKLPGVRFLALAKIESNQTQTSESHQSASESKDEKGKVTRSPETITKRNSRTVLASMHIYDLTKRNVAFSGQVTKTDQAERTYNVNVISDVLSVVNAIKGKDNDSTYPTPEAPDTRQVLANVFVGFAENFPKE